MSASALADTVRALAAALEDLRASYMIIGGLAVIVRGVARLTRDVDATVWGEGLDLGEALATFGRHGFAPRIPDAESFARRRFVMLLRHEPTETDVDVTIGWLPFERAAIDRAEEVDVAGVALRVAAVDDLIVQKAVAWRRKDQDDIEQLAHRHRATIDVKRVLADVAQFAEALDEADRVEDVRRLLG